MTITTAAPCTTTADVDLITALDAGLLPIQTPSVDALVILGNTAIASARERGIIAAGILERIIPDGVQIEEINVGRNAKSRAVFLHQDDVDHIALYFFDHTSSVSVYIENDDPDKCRHEEFASPAEMFDLVRDYYDA
jgi:hypothetical protein